MAATGDVVVQYDPWGRMGNRMFQYIFGYILAKRRGCNFFHEALPNFGIESNYTTPTGNTTNTKSYGNNDVDMNYLLSTNNTIIVDSYVQRAEYYLPFRDEIRRHLRCDKIETVNQDKLILHIRETDYTQINTFLGYEVYKKVIEAAGISDVVIVTDNSNCDTVQKLLSDGCILNTEGYVATFTHTSDGRAMEDFRTLLCSENIAISQSSFSWWAAFLGNQKNIYFPFTQDNALWKIDPQNDDIDLFFEVNKSYKIIV